MLPSISQKVLAGSFALALALALAAPPATVEAQPVDCDAARCLVHGEVDVECPCAEARSHGRYLACVARVVNRAVREGRMPKACRNKVNGCFIRSLCGKRERTVLCDLAGDGPSGRCRPLLSGDYCVARGGEVVSTCCPSCDAATPTPTPTASAGGATVTPIGPAATATPSPAGATPSAPPIATGTPSEPGATPTGDESPAATITTVAGETPAATPTAGAASATPAGTGTAEGAATVGAPTATIVLPSMTPGAAGSPNPTATAAAPLLVLVDGEPDTGPPPLAVQLTSDVSGGTPPYSYAWSFGDGSQSTDTNPLHVYQQLGDFTATLVVTDDADGQDSDELDVTVEPE